MYKAEVLADSINPQENRITTMKITFPRIMLAEFNTHRMFSRNSASSRAIPFNKMVKMVEENPFIPIAWQKDHKGMQGTEYLNLKESEDCIKRWLEARDNAVIEAKKLNSRMVTKQLCNRLLEPFMWHTVIVTSGKEGLDNFFELRCPQYEFGNKLYKSKTDWYKDPNLNLPEGFIGDNFPHETEEWWQAINKSQADIHIQAIAELMWDAINESTPKQLDAGEWHIPFGDNFSYKDVYNIVSENDTISFFVEPIEKIELTKIKIATARCARISYETLGDDPKIDYEADIRLHDMLLESKHFSPFEHCARAMSDEEYDNFIRGEVNIGFDIPLSTLGWCRNFQGFIQYRHLIDN